MKSKCYVSFISLSMVFLFLFPVKAIANNDIPWIWNHEMDVLFQYYFVKTQKGPLVKAVFNTGNPEIEKIFGMGKKEIFLKPKLVLTPLPKEREDEYWYRVDEYFEFSMEEVADYFHLKVGDEVGYIDGKKVKWEPVRSFILSKVFHESGWYPYLNVVLPSGKKIDCLKEEVFLKKEIKEPVA